MTEVLYEVACEAHPTWLSVTKDQYHEYVSHGWTGRKLCVVQSDWQKGFDDWWLKNRIRTTEIKGAEGFARKVWKAAHAAYSGGNLNERKDDENA